MNAAHGFEDQHRHLGLGLVSRQRHARDGGPDSTPRDVPGPSMVQGMRDHIILAFRAVAISRLQVAKAEKNFMHGFFEEILHCEDDGASRGVCRAHLLDAPIDGR